MSVAIETSPRYQIVVQEGDRPPVILLAVPIYQVEVVLDP